MNGVKFIRKNGGLGRELAGEDHISGLVVYGETAVAPTLLLSVEELNGKGIFPDTAPVLHYHITEFFRINEGAKLYVQSVASADGNYTEVKTLQAFAQGKLRQIAVCDFKTQLSSLDNALSKLNTIGKELAKRITPVSLLYSFKLKAEDIANLPDLHTKSAELVSVVIGQDGAGRGAYIAQTTPAVGCIGAALGAISKASVHESIGWVEKQNLVTVAYNKGLTGDVLRALELDVPALADGTKLGSLTPAQVEALNGKGYIFLTQYAGNAGTYFNDSFTATAATSDFAYIENNRTIDKAIRELNRVLVPKISGPAYIDPDTGNLQTATVSAISALCEEPLDAMKRNGELSGYKVYINPRQRILQTSKLEVVLKIVPVGTMREIEVAIGFALNV